MHPIELFLGQGVLFVAGIGVSCWLTAQACRLVRWARPRDIEDVTQGHALWLD